MRRPLLQRLDVWLLVTLAVHVVVRASYADFVPLYDSRHYYDECLLPAAHAAWPWSKLDCSGHTTTLFMGLLLLVQSIDLGSAPLLHATTTLLGIASIVAFDRLIARLIVVPELAWERRMLVACYALGPSCLSGGVNFSPDYGVLAFFVLMLERLLAGRLLAAAAWGTCMLFSKESGLLLYVAALGSYALHVWLRPRMLPTGEQLRGAAFALVPLLAFVARFVLLRASGTATWGGARTEAVALPMFLSVELLDPTFLAYAFDVFLLGFNWVLGVPLLLYVALSCARGLGKFPQRLAPGFEPRVARVVLTLALCAFFLLTRFKTVNNVRYLFPLWPLFVLSAGYALTALGLRTALRRALLGLSLLLTFSFNFHSFDPVSRSFFGTFKFGTHELLRGAAFDVCCGYGRDQIVYNLQFTELHYLQNQVYADLLSDPRTVLVAHKSATVQLAGRVDARTLQRTLRQGQGTRAVEILGVSELLERAVLPERIHFMALPNFDNRSALARLRQRYDGAGEHTYRRGRYALTVHALRRKR